MTGRWNWGKRGVEDAAPYNSCRHPYRRGLIFPPRNRFLPHNGGTGDPSPTHRGTMVTVGVGLRTTRKRERHPLSHGIRRASNKFGMIATGNHRNFDALRAAPLPRGEPSPSGTRDGTQAVPYSPCPDQHRRGLIFPPLNLMLPHISGTGDPSPTLSYGENPPQKEQCICIAESEIGSVRNEKCTEEIAICQNFFGTFY